MARKLLFILPSFQIGGTTVSTFNLISVLDKDQYDIKVWALDNHGLLKSMYDDVAQIQTCFIAQALSLSGWKKEDNWPRRIAAASIRLLAKHISVLRQYYIKRSIQKCLKGLRFDTVIACEEDFATEFTSYITCENRVSWVRCDYKRYFEIHKHHRETFYYKFNHIVCVAEQATKHFIEIYPELQEKVCCIQNPQDSNYIISRAEIDDHDIHFSVNGKRIIVSIGRLVRVKRFVQIPFLAKKLKEKGLSFVWFIIGDGDEKDSISDAIVQNHVEDCVIMLGAKSNPHYYIKKADLYVCLSVSEACPRVINEAKILGTPVVSTDYDTVYEFIENGENGIIAPIDNIADKVYEMLTDDVMYSSIRNNISNFTFDNTSLVCELEKIL